jgi:hypothetical protein
VLRLPKGDADQHKSGSKDSVANDQQTVRDANDRRKGRGGQK